MREVDRRAREEFGIPELILMEHAGLAVARRVRRLLMSASKGGRRVLILAGGGANGGDGFVAARHLDNWAIPVAVVLVADPLRIAGAAQVNLEILRRLSIPLQGITSPSEWRRWSLGQYRAGLIVDALLGTGVSGLIREPIRSAILWINRQRCPVVSVDLPSGLSAETGLPCDVAVQATETVTCGLPKVGMRSREGKCWCGRVTVAEISLPRGLVAWDS